MINKISALLTTFLLVVSINANTVFAQSEVPTPPAPPTAPSTPTQPEAPSAPPVPGSTSEPQPSSEVAPSTTPAPALTGHPKAEKTPHPKAATPKPATTAQAASTPKPAQTPVPAVTSVNDDQDNSPSASVPLITPQYAQSTGSQIQNGQIGQNTIQTGDANVGVKTSNQVNQNLIANPQSGSDTGSSSVSVSNQSNGDSSSNSISSNTSNSSDMQLGNVADLNNNIAVGAYTGGNSASRNTGDNAILTGDANVGVTVINGGNNNVQGLVVNQYDVNNNQSGDIVLGQSVTTASCGTYNVCTSGVLGSTENKGNGTDSNNSASHNTKNNSNISMQNEAEVVNNVAIDAVTGKNRADSNVGNANIETGDVNVAVTILNFLNNNILAGIVDVVNIFDDYNGDIVIPEQQQSSSVAGNNAPGNYVSNKQNGDSSANSASQSNSLEKNVGQTNVADIDNNINVNANTGENRAASNTQGDNNVQTGDVAAHAQVYNLANINSTEGGYVVLVNDKGTWRGKIVGAEGSQDIDFVVQPDGTVVATNQGNGAESTNHAQASNSTTENVTQSNSATLQNNVNITADTGNNSASRNTGGDSTVSTGDVNVGASIMNFVNNNFVGKTFRVLLVNVFGEWGGRVRSSNEAATSQNQAPAIGGVSADSSSATSPTPQPTTQPIASSTNLSPEDANNPVGANNSTKITNRSQVLGSMTNNPSGEGFSLVLDDGRTYFSDDTIQTTQQPPLVAADVQARSETGFNLIWILLVLPLLAGSFFGFRKVRGLIA